jgi:hypothetical protein
MLSYSLPFREIASCNKYAGKNMGKICKLGIKLKITYVLSRNRWGVAKQDFIVSSVKGIVSPDFVICFLVSIDRSEVPTHKERVHLLLKFCFCVEFFDFRVWV